MTVRRNKWSVTYFISESNRLNNFAISSQGVGEILLRSASAMASANNTLDETIALGSAANEIVQSPEKVGNALKTISMYLRSSKSDLEDAGESVEGLVESTPKLQSLLKSIAGVDILQSDGQTFKSTYQILQELSKVWGTLTDVNKASVLEAIGGKRNANITSAIITNFAKAEEILETSANSSGSALAENEKYLDSIDGKISQLKSTFESVSLNFLDSETVKGFIDTLNKLLQTVEKLTSNKYGATALVSGLVGGIGLTSNKTSFGFKIDDIRNITATTNALQQYSLAVMDGMSAQDAFNATMNDAPDLAKKTAQAIGTNVSGYKSATGALVSLTGAKIADIGKTVLLTAATTALNAAISMGISLLIQGAIQLGSWVIKQISTTEHLAEKLSTVNDELQTLKSEAETLSDELQTTKDRIAELEAQDSLTLVEENELAKLRQAVAWKQTLIKLNQDEINAKVKEQKTATKDYIESSNFNNVFDMYSNQEAQQIYKEYQELEQQREEAYDRYQKGLISDSEYYKYRNNVDNFKNSLDTSQKGLLASMVSLYDNIEDVVIKENGVKDQLAAIYDTGYIYGSDEEMDNYIDSLNQILDLYYICNGDFDSFWKNLLGRGQFDEARNALEGLGDNLTADSLKGLMESNDAVAEFISYISRLGLINWKDILGDDAFIKADKDANGYLDTSEMLTLSQDNLTKGLSGVANQFKEVSEAAEEATPTLKQYADEYNRIVGYGTKGNVDYNKRPVVSDKDMWAAGWNDFVAGDWATTFDMDYGLYKPDSEEIGYTVKVTPILENGKILTPTELDNYVWNDLQSILDSGGSYQDMLDYDKSHYGLVIHSAVGEVDFSTLDDQLYEIKSKHLDVYMKNVANSIKDIATSLESCTKRKDEIADMMAELRDDGELSNDSMLKLFEKFSEVDGFNYYIAALTNTNATIEEQKQILNDLYGAYIDLQGITDNLTEDTYDYAVARLKALGVTNAEEVATAGLVNSLVNAAGVTGEINAQTEILIQNKLLESGATKQVANDYISAAKQVVQAQYNMTQALSTQTKTRIKNIGIEMSAIQSYEELYLALRKKATASGDSTRWSAYVNQGNRNESLKVIYGDFAGQYNALKTMYGKDFADEMWEYYLRSDAASKARAELDKILSQVNNGSLTDYVYDVSVSPTDKSSSSTDKYKQEFEDWYSKLKYLRDTNQKSEEQYLKELDVKNKAYFGNKTEYLEEYAKYSQEVYEGFKKLYQEDLNAQKEALEEQKDQLKELADARKEALDDAKDEEDYNKEQSEKREEINKLKVLISSFRGTLSLSSQKKLRELQQELAEKEEELAEFESDKALERAKEDIDKEYENQEKQINTKIENIESLLEKVSDDLPEIRNAVISFAKKYGVTITSAYATGTNSSIGGLALTQERGSELIAANVKSGNFTMLTPNSKVWNASATQALYDFANSPEAFIGGIMDKISTFKNKAMSMFYSQPVNVTVGGVTVNGNADTKTVQQIKQGQREQIERMLKEFKKIQ